MSFTPGPSPQRLGRILSSGGKYGPLFVFIYLIFDYCISNGGLPYVC